MRPCYFESVRVLAIIFGTFIAGAAGAQEGDTEMEKGHFISSTKFFHGTYGFSLSEFCVETPRQPPPAQGFDPESRALSREADAVIAVLMGVMRFDLYGNVFVQDATISDLFIDATGVGDVPIASGTPLSCEGTYTIERSKRIELVLDCAAELPNGVGVTIGPFQLEGFLGRFGLSIPISSIAGNIQTETVSVGGVAVAERERVCLLRGTLAKL